MEGGGFSETSYADRFFVLLNNIRTAFNGKRDVLENIGRKLYRRARYVAHIICLMCFRLSCWLHSAKTGARPVDDQLGLQPDALQKVQAELQNRAGLTDSEDDGSQGGDDGLQDGDDE